MVDLEKNTNHVGANTANTLRLRDGALPPAPLSLLHMANTESGDSILNAGQALSGQTTAGRRESFSSQNSQTAKEFIESQIRLEADAREVLPYSFDTCTQDLGPLRQSLFACLTCNPSTSEESYTPAAVCYSCSISCHGEHDLVELFNKRNFVCDCGTTRMPATSPCTLRNDPKTGAKGVHSEQPHQGNKYNHNFQNKFCGCGEDYDPHKERGTMFQCLGLGTVETGGCGEDWWHPECLIGLPRDWYKDTDKPITTEPSFTSSNPSAPKHTHLPTTPPSRTFSLFLKDDFRDHFCRCRDCYPHLASHPQLREEEETYEPPMSEDGDGDGPNGGGSTGTGSLLDRGEAALSNIDRVRAIEGAMVYNHLRDKVKEFLKPFAETGKAVSAEDIKSYFEKLRGDEQSIRDAASSAAGGGGGDDGDGGDGGNRREQSVDVTGTGWDWGAIYGLGRASRLGLLHLVSR
ncbi:uncharacterized protein An09g04650 [Aspergillus niger]|uniref:Contig An09c0130, genomic contig n=2 Tax=Aspergillus niger TaxID=5061 RepID=A2QU76_ASPNC|nr:uncharacterized protein An09g04650 [Aspergillus niger]CAK40319.1 unnamed protein product [Aspergillus niger]